MSLIYVSTLNSISDHIKPLKNYSINVYSIYDTVCSPPEMIKASLNYGSK